MGKDFIMTIENGFNLNEIYNKLFSESYEVTETSNEKFFNRIPLISEIENIEIGTNGTKESIIRLKNKDFVVLNKTIDIKTLNK
jgi:hypothetical protein